MQVNLPYVLLNGKLDLSEAEAVADLISSDNERSQIAMQQMRGGFLNEIIGEEELLALTSNSELDLPKKM
jgi:tRNA modification GTPase